MNNNVFNMAMIGSGGYAGYLIGCIAELPDVCRVAAVITRNPASEAAQKYKVNGISIYGGVDEFIQHVSPADCPAVIVSTSIESHFDFTKKLIDYGFHVLLEKPPVSTIQDMDRLIELQRTSGQWITVNFQFLFNSVTQELKRRLCAGEFGKIKSVKSKALWPRPESYFTRSHWSGCLQVNNLWVLDGTIGNPLAHLLAEVLYLASEKPGMAKPVSVQAELYHVNDIESEDTSCLRVITGNGVPVFYCATLCSKETHPVCCEIQTEKAQIRLTDFCTMEIVWQDGRIEKRETPYSDGRPSRMEMLRSVVCDLSENKKPLITAEECRAYMLAWNGAFESAGIPPAVPAEFISCENGVRSIQDAEKIFSDAYEQQRLFSEIEIPWSRAGVQIDLSGYDFFPSVHSSFMAHNAHEKGISVMEDSLTGTVIK